MPTIFNLVVDAVVRHWEYLMAEGAWGDERDDIGGDEVGQPTRQMVRV